MNWGRVRAARATGWKTWVAVLLFFACLVVPAAAQTPRVQQSLWQSPTAGKPLDVSALPSGVQMIVALRPAELLAHPEGAKLLDPRASGDAGTWLADFAKQTGVELKHIEQLLLGLSSTGKLSYVVQTAAPPDLPKLLKAWGQPQKQRLGGVEAYVGGDRMHIVRGRTIASAPPTDDADRGASDLLAGSPTFLRRELEELLAETDSQRHLTVLVAPQFLFAGGDYLLAGLPLAIRQEVKSLASPDGRQMAKAASASLHLGDDYFYAELRIHGGTSYRPVQVIRDVSRVLTTLPTRTKGYFAASPPSQYSREVLEQYPKMLTVALQYLRTQGEHRHAVFCTALPLAAAHNLTFATRLAMAERQAPPPANPVPPRALTLNERLNRRISMQLPRDAFDRIVPELASELGLPILLEGKDLELEGITKAFNFEYSVQNATGREALNRLVQIVNPDRTAKGLDDPKQKLVYVIDDSGGTGKERIVITVRSQAKKRGKPPAEFGIK